MTAEVQSWQVSPATDFGWLVLGDESAGATAKRFDTRERAGPPVLTIQYTTATPTPTPTATATPTTTPSSTPTPTPTTTATPTATATPTPTPFSHPLVFPPVDTN